MVLGNGDNIQSKTRELIASLSKIDMTLLNGEAHMYWMELLRPMQSSLGIILSTGNLDVQRLEFINLSKALINSVKSSA